MAKLTDKTIEQIYSGWLGKVIGIRLGAPVEMWTAEQIEEAYHGKDGYLKDYSEFAADDDSNGPIFFFRTLKDFPEGIPEPREFGLTWLNYAAEGHGFYWWGGYGVSTEHTAYLNMQNGIEPPGSGSILQNGKELAEQIGGQIFSDVWGLVAPSDPQLAAKLSEHAARVSHDGAAVDGARFVAACISAAFSAKDLNEIIESGLSVIDPEGDYAKTVKDIRKFQSENPDPKACFRYIRENYWRDKFPGNCHIIPNIAIMAMSLFYGGGEFDKSLKLCNEAGFDTDCNCANVGCILGVFNGLEKIDYAKWRAPIGDLTLCSSAVGNLNIVDIPAFVFEIVRASQRLSGEKYAGKYSIPASRVTEIYGFELPNSTHGFRTKDCELSNTDGKLKMTPRSGQKGAAFRHTYFRPEDLADNRYDPCFSPILYPGQTVSVRISGKEGTARIFAEDVNSGKRFASEPVKFRVCADLKLELPAALGVCFGCFGIEWESADPVYLERAGIHGACEYGVDFSKSKTEYFALGHEEVREFTHRKGHWIVENGEMAGSCCDYGEAYSGKYDMRDCKISARCRKETEGDFGILFRVQGNIRSYGLFVNADGTVSIEKNENGYRALKQAPFECGLGKSVELSVEVCGDRIRALADGKPILEVQDPKAYSFGCFGAAVRNGCRAKYQYFRVKETIR